jgi:hypothetical protein
MDSPITGPLRPSSLPNAYIGCPSAILQLYNIPSSYKEPCESHLNLVDLPFVIYPSKPPLKPQSPPHLMAYTKTRH